MSSLCRCPGQRRRAFGAARRKSLRAHHVKTAACLPFLRESRGKLQGNFLYATTSILGCRSRLPRSTWWQAKSHADHPPLSFRVTARRSRPTCRDPESRIVSQTCYTFGLLIFLDSGSEAGMTEGGVGMTILKMTGMT